MSITAQQNQTKLIDYLIESFPDGVKTGELADRLGVTAQTVRNYLTALEAQGIYIQEQGGRYTLDPNDNPRKLYLSLPEAWTLYLPLRRGVRANHTRKTTVRHLLNKLAEMLLHGDIAKHLQDDDSIENSVDNTVFETLVEGWYRARYVQIRYRPPDSQPSKWVIAPWWFEPAVWSDSNYLIGAVHQHGEIKTVSLKLDRILEATLLSERFDRPNIEELMHRIRETWGIWQGNDTPVRVLLRFANRQYDRLHETHWHPTEQIRVDKAGFVLWEALISEPREMKPWIRGWGADVEVIEPDWLRKEIASEAAQTVRLYGHSSSIENDFF